MSRKIYVNGSALIHRFSGRGWDCVLTKGGGVSADLNHLLKYLSGLLQPFLPLCFFISFQSNLKWKILKEKQIN